MNSEGGHWYVSAPLVAAAKSPVVLSHLFSGAPKRGSCPGERSESGKEKQEDVSTARNFLQ